MPFGTNRFDTGTFGGGGSFGSPSLVFTGPVTFTRPMDTPRDPDRQAWLLLRHYGPQPEGVNVYMMTDGSVTTNEPTDWALVRRVLWGAHYEPITEAEANILDAAGYGEFIQ